MRDPVTGPLSKEEFSSLVDAPFGKAIERIRDFDPEYGRKPGEKFRWKVTASCEMRGVAYVLAASREEADELADNLPRWPAKSRRLFFSMKDAEFDWDCRWDGDIEIISVEPDKK